MLDAIYKTLSQSGSYFICTPKKPWKVEVKATTPNPDKPFAGIAAG